MSRYACLTVALVASGCALPERGDPSRVAVPAPKRWQASPAPGDVDGDWWRKFPDPGLQAAIAHALDHNHDLLAARARLLAAASQARLAGAAGAPRVDAGAGATRQRTVFVGLPTSFGGGRPLSNTYENYGVSLNASWELDLWGRIGAAADAATAELRATAADLRGLRQSLAAQTAKAWFAAVAAREQIALAEATVASYRTTEAQVEDRFRRGVRSALDLRLARSRRMSGEAQLLQWRERFEQSVRQLQAIQGRYPDGQATVPDRLPDPAGAIAAGLPAGLVARRPDLVAATERLAAAGFRVAEAQAALYPQLSLSGGVGTTSAQASDLLDLDFLIWNLAANLVGPLLDGGARREQRALAIAREHEAIAHFARTALQAYTEVETLLGTEAILRQRGDRLAAATTESVAARTLSEDRYRRGVGDYIAVLEAQRSALAIQAQAINNRQQLHNLCVDLHLALGGGFEPTPPAPESAGEPLR
jgi:NodT family efflux transporter outer membrane factor (OMF) lipoprotein